MPGPDRQTPEVNESQAPSALEQAALEITTFLTEASIPHMVIGGFANIFWGAARTTFDVDVTLWAGEEIPEDLIDKIVEKFHARPEKPFEFACTSRVLPIALSNGVQADLIFGLLPYEHDAIERAVDVDLSGASIKVCSAEDLVLHKILAPRAKDIADIAGIVHRQGDGLDLAYLDPRVAEVAVLLEDPEIEERWKKLKAEAGLS